MLKFIIILIAIFIVGTYGVAANNRTKELEEKFKELKDLTERSIKLNGEILADYNKHSAMAEEYMSVVTSIAKADHEYEDKKIESLLKLMENFEKKYGNSVGE